jgi:predicted HTH transcriptional regulator
MPESKIDLFKDLQALWLNGSLESSFHDIVKYLEKCYNNYPYECYQCVKMLIDGKNNITENVTDCVTDYVTEKTTAEKRRDEILRLMKLDKKITYDNLANILHVSRMTISRDINSLRSQNRLMREGGDYNGIWIVNE